MSFTPKQQALATAAAELSEKHGTNAELIKLLAVKFVEAVSAQLVNIVDVALSDENDGKVNVGFRIALSSLNKKTPCGKCWLSFSQRRVMEMDFAVEDPDQARLPFADAVRPAATPFVPDERRVTRPAGIIRDTDGTPRAMVVVDEIAPTTPGPMPTLETASGERVAIPAEPRRRPRRNPAAPSIATT